jgi:hypothetical protein
MLLHGEKDQVAIAGSGMLCDLLQRGFNKRLVFVVTGNDKSMKKPELFPTCFLFLI